MWGVLVEDGGLGTQEMLGSQKPPSTLCRTARPPREQKGIKPCLSLTQESKQRKDKLSTKQRGSTLMSVFITELHFKVTKASGNPGIFKLMLPPCFLTILAGIAITLLSSSVHFTSLQDPGEKPEHPGEAALQCTAQTLSGLQQVN